MTERSEAEWNELASEGHGILKRIARDKSLTNYGDFNQLLMDETGLPGFNFSTDQGRADMGKLLNRIAHRDWTRNPDFMLTSLVKLTGENMPGQGFFKLADEEDFFDPDSRDQMDFWQEQVGLAHDCYRRGGPGWATN